MANAENGIALLKENVDAIVTIPNDNLLQIIDKKTGIMDTFRMADDILRQGVQGISDIIAVPGYINCDFADVVAIMKEAGIAHMGVGSAKGENKAEEAVKMAIESPLLETSIDGARGVLLNITGGRDLSMFDANQAAQLVQDLVDSDAKIIFGVALDEALEDEMRITLVATGFDSVNPSKPGYKDIFNKVSSDGAARKEKEDSFFPSANIELDNVDIPTFLKNRNQ